ncbi:hypothetical protein M1N64_01315 [Peptococcaceae bacterium]|nr:hypothetical protein [Peptococcaceae bacterium]
MPYCDNCGSETADSEDFCANCGQKQRALISQVQKEHSCRKDLPINKSKIIIGKNNKTVLIIATAVVLVLGILVGLIYYPAITTHQIDTTSTQADDTLPTTSQQIQATEIIETATEENLEIKDIIFEIEVSSTLQETVSGNLITHKSGYISDNNITTAWVEGSRGDGAGEWLSFNSEKKFDLNTLQITNGYLKSERLYYRNNRIAELKLVSSEGDSKVLRLKDHTLGMQDFEIGFKNIHGVKIIITEVFKGSHFNDLCISELRFNNQLLNLQ